MKRREFLGAVGVAAGWSILAGRGMAAPPSERVVLGFVGTGGRGSSLLREFAGQRDVEVAGLCDVDRERLDRTLATLRSRGEGTRARGYRDFRRLLERDDVDGIVCATPDHWHAAVTVHSFLAGKDVYCEKPLSYSLEEGRRMLDECRRRERIFQLGTQIHAGENYHRVVELIRSGVIGRVHTVRVWKNGGAPYIPFVHDREPPGSLDWDLWLGPAPLRSYNPHRAHFRFRYFWEYSGGVFADFWCHISDIVFWALEPGSPRTIEARGEPGRTGMATTPAWIDVDYEFPELKYFWTTRTPDIPGAEGRGIGAAFEGTEGTLVTDYGSRVLFRDGRKQEDVPEVPRSIPRSKGHSRNFLDSVKSRRLPESHLEYAHPMTVPMHLGNISFRTGRKLRWDGERERIIDDEEANRLLFRPYRKPWSLSS